MLARCQTCSSEASETGLRAMECDCIDDDALLCGISASDGEWLMVDSGAAVSVCPLDYAPEVALTAKGIARRLRTVTGAPIKHEGSKSVRYVHENGATMSVSYEVADVRRPIAAVNNFVDRGMTVVFTRDGGFVARAGVAPLAGPLLEIGRGSGHFSAAATRRRTKRS